MIISPNPWGQMLISKHNYAIELGKRGFKVFFVNAPNENPNTKYYSINKINDYENLWLIDINLIRNRLINFLRFRLRITQILDYYLLFLIRRICKHHNLYFDQVWNFDPNLHGFFYNYPAFKKLFFIADQISSSTHLRAAKKADGVISVASEILNHFRKVNKNCLLINHGINSNYQTFAENNLGALQNSKDGNYNLKRIQVGYIGNLMIKSLYSQGLLQIISNHPEIDFHFWGADSKINNNVFGGSTNDIDETIEYIKKTFANTFFYGVQKPEFIIQAISNIDAFIYINSSELDINGGANSHKILEYLSTGKVIISTYLSFYSNKNLFPMTEKYKEEEFSKLFSDCIEKIQQLNSIEKQKQRIEFALSNSYQSNINAIFNFINYKP
jgi:hypothetical protein